jgi:DNA-binding LacI/PurR family transcriptional regulator
MEARSPTRRWSQVRYGSELMQDGPYLQVVLPDVVPPDWDALRRDVEFAIDEGATRVTVIASDRVGVETDDDRLEAMLDTLRDEGVEVVVFRQGEPNFGDVFPFEEVPRR